MVKSKNGKIVLISMLLALLLIMSSYLFATYIISKEIKNEWEAAILSLDNKYGSDDLQFNSLTPSFNFFSSKVNLNIVQTKQSRSPFAEPEIVQQVTIPIEINHGPWLGGLNFGLASFNSQWQPKSITANNKNTSLINNLENFDINIFGEINFDQVWAVKSNIRPKDDNLDINDDLVLHPIHIQATLKQNSNKISSSLPKFQLTTFEAFGDGLYLPINTSLNTNDNSETNQENILDLGKFNIQFKPQNTYQYALELNLNHFVMSIDQSQIDLNNFNLKAVQSLKQAETISENTFNQLVWQLNVDANSFGFDLLEFKDINLDSALLFDFEYEDPEQNITTHLQLLNKVPFTWTLNPLSFKVNDEQTLIRTKLNTLELPWEPNNPPPMLYWLPFINIYIEAQIPKTLINQIVLYQALQTYQTLNQDNIESILASVDTMLEQLAKNNYVVLETTELEKEQITFDFELDTSLIYLNNQQVTISDILGLIEYHRQTQ